MKEYVDFEGSSPRGQWYMRSVYINIGVAVFRWIKELKSLDERQKLLNTYDAIALKDIHDDITVDDFT